MVKTNKAIIVNTVDSVSVKKRDGQQLGANARLGAGLAGAKRREMAAGPESA